MVTRGPVTYGPLHRTFALRPVDTQDQGWKWLRGVWRRRAWYDLTGHPARRAWLYWTEDPR